MIQVKNISIRSKIVLMIFFVSLFSITIGFGIILFLEYQDSVDDLGEELKLKSDYLAKYIEMPMLVGDELTIREELSAISEWPFINDANVYDHMGTEILKLKKNYFENFPSYKFVDKDTIIILDDLIVANQEIKNNNEVIGYLQLRANYDTVYEKVYDLLFTLIVLYIIIILSTYFIAIYLQGFISKPILKLSMIMDEISTKGDYSIRIKNKREDEVGMLFKGFNKMLEQINLREIERDIAENAVIESEERLRLLVESSGNIVTVNDLLSNYVYVSCPPEYGKAEEMIGRKASEFFNKEYADYLNSRLEKVVNSGKAITEERQLPWRFEKVWFSEYIYPMKDGLGNIVGIVTISTNINERIKAEREIKELNQDLERRVIDRTSKLEAALIKLKEEIEARKKFEIQIKKAKEEAETANKLKSEFLANMSHEIRTPMNAILGFSEILYNKIEAPKLRGYLSVIQNSGETLLALINDILDMSKIEADKLEFNYEAINVEKILLETMQIFSQKISEKKLNTIIEIDQNMPKAIMLDDLRLRQILFNIIGNAIKFTNKGYIRIYASYHQIDEEKVKLILEIEDSGIGIPKDEFHVIFEAFRQKSGQSTREYGGTGLGLAITKRLVDKMNGSITVDSDQFVGSIFRIEFNDIDVVEFKKSEVKIDFDSEGIEFHESNLLIVDDFLYNRRLVKDYLEDTNVKVIEAQDGKEALNLLDKGIKVDLILMDMKMPIKDGYETSKALKESIQFRDIPIIAFTALNNIHSNMFDITDGKLIKPISKDSLYNEMKKFLKFDELEFIDNSKDKNLPLSSKLLNTYAEQEEIKNPSELIKELENGFLQQQKKLLKGLIIDDCETFAHDLNNLSQKHNSSILNGYAEKLLTSIEEFDINLTKALINDFSTIIDKIKKVNT